MEFKERKGEGMQGETKDSEGTEGAEVSDGPDSLIYKSAPAHSVSPTSAASLAS